jgi:hypothetical protein
MSINIRDIIIKALLGAFLQVLAAILTDYTAASRPDKTNPS